MPSLAAAAAVSPRLRELGERCLTGSGGGGDPFPTVSKPFCSTGVAIRAAVVGSAASVTAAALAAAAAAVGFGVVVEGLADGSGGGGTPSVSGAGCRPVCPGPSAATEAGLRSEMEYMQGVELS